MKEIKPEKAEQVELSPEEKQIISDNRARAAKMQACGEELNKLMTKYNAQLKVNPNSPIGNPQIIIQSLD